MCVYLLGVIAQRLSLHTHAQTHTHAPVLQLLAVDAHGPLVALGDTHLVPAALNLLAGVLGGVDVWSGGGKTKQKAR